MELERHKITPLDLIPKPDVVFTVCFSDELCLAELLNS
jgi:hypothetical protein